MGLLLAIFLAEHGYMTRGRLNFIEEKWMLKRLIKGIKPWAKRGVRWLSLIFNLFFFFFGESTLFCIIGVLLKLH